MTDLSSLSDDELVNKIVSKFKLRLSGRNITVSGINYWNRCRTVNMGMFALFPEGIGSAIRKVGDVQLNKYLDEFSRRYGRREAERLENYLWDIVRKNSEGK